MAATHNNKLKSCLVFTTFFVVVLVISCSQQVSSMNPPNCEGDLQALEFDCMQFVKKSGPWKNPSQACCDNIKGLDIPCVCQHITKNIEQKISMKKLVDATAFCGKPLESGFKCGSYRAPVTN